MAPSVTELPSLCSMHSPINLPREPISWATLVLFVRAGSLIDVSLSADDLAAETVDVSPPTSVGMPAVSQMAAARPGPRGASPSLAAAAVKAHRGAVLDHLQAMALQLRLVDPAIARRTYSWPSRAPGLDEAKGRP